MVPVDDNGNVLPGYEHLLEPRVVLLNREEIQKLNNTNAKTQSLKSVSPLIEFYDSGTSIPFAERILIFVVQDLIRGQ